MITYESGESTSVIDYMLVKKGDRGMVRDLKVITGEECIPQHKLLMYVVLLKKQVMRERGKGICE